MNIIIVGCGKVGETLAAKLSAEPENNLTVIDINPLKVQELTNYLDVMGVVGNGASIDVLADADVEHADVLIAVTGSDELNLLTSFVAKKTGDCQTIARVRKPEYIKSVVALKEDMGLAMIINPEQTAAREIARALRFPSAIQIDTFAKGRVEILKFKLPEGAPIDGIRLADMKQKVKCNVLVCGVERGEEAFIPDGNFVLKAGDFVSIVASPEDGAEFFRKIGIKTNKVKNTIIVGGGDTAYYLAKLLLQTGIDVKIIEKDQNRAEELCRLLPKATIINGDGTDRDLLMEEGIEYTESFVSLTNIDEENILLSLFAKSKSPAKLVTKINRIAYDEVINNLDLDTTIYPKEITAEYIIRFVRAKNNSIGSNIETMHLILDDKAEALQFGIKADSPIAGIPLEKLNLKNNLVVACIHRHGRVIIPGGKDEIQPGDSVVVVTARKGFTDISDILE